MAWGGRRRYPTAAERKRFAPYRSGLEKSIADDLRKRNVTFDYEWTRIPFMQPAKRRTYTPDFRVGDIIIEAKGEFTTEDRQKHLWLKEQHPNLDIRFVFSNPANRISARSKTTYAAWCDKHGFRWAKGFIPQSWLEEMRRKRHV